MSTLCYGEFKGFYGTQWISTTLCEEIYGLAYRLCRAVGMSDFIPLFMYEERGHPSKVQWYSLSRSLNVKNGLQQNKLSVFFIIV